MTDSQPAAESGCTRDFLALAFAIALPTLVTLVYFEWLEDFSSQFQQVAFAIGKIIQFGFPLAWVWLWYRKRLRHFFLLLRETPAQTQTKKSIATGPPNMPTGLA